MNEKLIEEARKAWLESQENFVSQPLSTDHQPVPHGKGREIFPLVLRDLEMWKRIDDSVKTRATKNKIMLDLVKRKEYRIKEYGEQLKAYNGRDVEIDAKQKALDLLVYMRQGIEEGVRWGKSYYSIMRAVGEMYEECKKENKKDEEDVECLDPDIKYLLENYG